VVDYRKYDVNVTVTINEDTGIVQ